MSSKSILINYVGYPNEPFNLMPDNGLASLAACLVERGHHTVVWDCTTVGIVERLFPYEHLDAFSQAKKNILGAFKRGEKPPADDFQAFYDIESKIDNHEAIKIREIAKEISAHVKRNKIDFAGMKLWTGAGFYGSMIIARQIRMDNPGVLIFGGGPHVDWFGERIFRMTDVFDVLAYGEGERTITLLADLALKKIELSNIPNIIYKRGSDIIKTPLKMIENLDELPLATYDNDIYPAMRGDQKIKAILFDESRGCPNSCNFCVHPQKSGKKRRIRDPKKVVSDLQTMYNKYNFTAFRFSGSNPPGYVLRAIARELISRNLNLRYSAYAHVKGFLDEDFGLLKRSGCVTLSFGVESGSQSILDQSINKRVSVEETKRVLMKCQAAGVNATASIIMPAPNETVNTKNETFQFLKDVRPASTLVFFPLLIPGTEWHHNKNKYGFEIRNEDKFFDDLMTFRANHLAPPVLWRKFDDYRINQKDSLALGKETAEFTNRLEKIGLTTQLFDQTLLLASYADIDPKEFSDKFHLHLSNGDHSSIQNIVAETNSRIENLSTTVLTRSN